MKKITLLLIIVSLVFTPVFAQDKKAKLDAAEIKKSQKIKFINRNRRKASETIREQNEAIGTKLAEQVSAGGSGQLGNLSVQRFPATEELYGGDVFIIGEGASFGHVNSIKRILASYLELSFEGYDQEDLEVLALYILYYNAMHRGGDEFFGEKYTPELNAALEKDRIGIDKSYRNWPGKTQIIIPIQKNILDEKDVVTDELKEEVDKVIKTKKNGTESKKQFDELQKKKEERVEKKVVEKKKELAKKETQLAKKETALTKEIKELKKDPVKNKEAIQEKTAEKKKVTAEKQKVQKQAKKLAEKSSTSGSPKKSAQKAETKEELKKELKEVKQELAGKKAAEVQKEQFDENVVNNKILFLKTLKYVDQGHYNNELQMLDPLKDDLIIRGNYNNICGNEFHIFNDQVVVIGYTNNHADSHNITLVNKESLTKMNHSDIEVFWRTPMIVKGKDLYVFEAEGEKYYLSRLDGNLKRVAKSEADISPDSNVTFFGEKIYITGRQQSTGKMDIVVLKKADLTLVKRIQP